MGCSSTLVAVYVLLKDPEFTRKCALRPVGANLCQASRDLLLMSRQCDFRNSPGPLTAAGTSCACLRHLGDFLRPVAGGLRIGESIALLRARPRGACVGTGNTERRILWQLSSGAHPKRSDMSLQPIRCHHCHRRLSPTRHSRHGTTVDYYRTVTGPLRGESEANPKTPESGVEARQGRRVESLTEFSTCCDCWERREIQEWLEQARSSGLIDP